MNHARFLSNWVRATLLCRWPTCARHLEYCAVTARDTLGRCRKLSKPVRVRTGNAPVQNRALPAAFQLRSRPSCTSRAHKAETQCTRGAQRQRSRCQQQRYNAALHRQSYSLPYSALARQSACMLVLRLHLAATAMSDRTQASFRHRPRRQPRPMSRISTQPASIRTGAVHDGGLRPLLITT